MGRKHLVVGWCAVLLLHLWQAVVYAQAPTARASVDSTHFLVGDAIPVHVRITHAHAAIFRPLFGDTLGGFTVLGRSPIRQEGETTTTTEIVVAKYDSGDAVLPPLKFLCALAGDTTTRTISTNEILLSIRTVPVDTTQEIKDLKPPISIPLAWWEVLLYLAGLGALVALAYVLYRWRKKRKTTVAGDIPPASRRPAHVIAFDDLGCLKEKRLWQQGLIKQYYTEVTEILRRYMENRYSLMALERTTDEILDDLRRLRMKEELLGKADGLLRRADLVKFAKHQPVLNEHEESMQTAYDFVERTKIVEQVTTGEGEGKNNVGS
jgi:hypothetical protein